MVPPAGIYAISLNFVYHSTDLRDENGDRVTQVNGEKFKGRAEAFLNITSLTYISDLKVFGEYTRPDSVCATKKNSSRTLVRKATPDSCAFQ